MVPSFPVTHAILFTQIGDGLNDFRAAADEPLLPSETWAFYNLLGDALALIAHCVVGILALVLIEADLFACLTRMTVRTIPGKKTDLVIDEDVLAEENRIANESTDNAKKNNQIS